ncbi:zinc finger protein [Forsythia ovata]|uniref:Zinc finger protein n=1 Tax=Forsythia ovata TaxID=205694 RepID=A0ABD1V0Q1_9LAMI
MMDNILWKTSRNIRDLHVVSFKVPQPLIYSQHTIEESRFVIVCRDDITTTLTVDRAGLNQQQGIVMSRSNEEICYGCRKSGHLLEDCKQKHQCPRRGKRYVKWMQVVRVLKTKWRLFSASARTNAYISTFK